MADTIDKKIRDQMELVLNRYGELMVANIIRILREEDKVASGKLIKSFNYKIVEDVGTLQLLIESSANYSDIVDVGRKAGKQPPPSALQKWMNQKGIKGNAKSLSFVIGRKIGRFGIKGVFFNQRTLDKYQRNLIQDLNNLKGLDSLINETYIVNLGNKF